MKTFLKVLLIAAVLVAAIKLSPVLVVIALVGYFAATVLGAVGLSLVAVLGVVLVALVLALSPIWIPVLVVFGLVSLFRRDPRTPPRAAAA